MSMLEIDLHLVRKYCPHLFTGFILIFLSVPFGTVFGLSFFSTGPEQDPDNYWSTHSSGSEERVEHDIWQSILDDYLVVDSSGINLFDYEGLQISADPRLDAYIDSVAMIDPLALSRDEQMSYWINLYNALTIKLIVKNYPVNSITELGESVLSRGPWDDYLITINNRSLSLNDIEHRILRPFFNDYRIHFAVNCASYGCPNLSVEVFTALNLESLLDRLIREYLAHPRGLQFIKDQLHLSSIFQWYQTDFAENPQQLLQLIVQYVPPEMVNRVKQYTGEIEYHYDWRLNGI